MKPDTPNEPSRAYRFAAVIHAELHHGSQNYPCDAHNLSRTGVLLLGSFPGPIEGTVHLTLKSDHGDLRVGLEGQVARLEGRQHDETGEIAVRFAELDASQKDVLERLLSRIIEGEPPPATVSVRPGAPPHEVRAVLEAVPLAHRIVLATRAGLREREVLRHDQNPQVLQALARNPSFSLEDARALASTPAVPAVIVEMIALNPRFRHDEELRVLLLAHPHVPPPTGEKLLAEMGAPSLRRALARSGLSELLRIKIQKRLSRLRA